jgi:hypothetical protein
MALHALTQCAARLLLAAQQQTTTTSSGGSDGDGSLHDDWRVYRALAELGMEERARGSWCGLRLSLLLSVSLLIRWGDPSLKVTWR